MYTDTYVNIPEGETVENILKEAEIEIQEEDQVTPDLHTKVTSPEENIKIRRHTRVKISVDGEKEEVELTGGKVKHVLKKTGVTLGDHDLINHDLDAFLTDGMHISVIHRLEVTLTADGEKTSCLTDAKTVGEFLNQQKIKIGKNDRVKPSLKKELKEGTKIVVKRVDIKEEKEVQEIPFQTQTRKTNQMTIGTSKVERNGQNGKKEVTYQVTYVDGKEESKKIVDEKVLEKPIDKIVLEGTKSKGKTIISKEKVYDCDGSGHGYYIIKYSDGTVKYVDF